MVAGGWRRTCHQQRGTADSTPSPGRAWGECESACVRARPVFNCVYMEKKRCWQSAAVRWLAVAVRSIPVSRGKMRLFGPLIALSSAFEDYQFVCRRGLNLVWSTRGLPDLLTQHMLLDGFYQWE